jgi:glycosyltransferase involved in cell wall biosynthesis
MHRELARRRCYLHLNRWTSLGLSLLEAMMLGVPPIALAATEAPATVPPDGGIVSNDLEALHVRYRDYLADPGLAAAHGAVARRAACERHGLRRFLDDWDDVLTEVTP